MNWLELVLAIVIVICVIVIAIVLYNFMLLLSELNKRLIYIITDILGNIDLSTPHLDTLNQDDGIKIEDILEDTEEAKYFNPHEFDVDSFEEENS